MDNTSNRLRFSALHGWAWSVIGSIGIKGISFLTTIVLSWLLLPEDIGAASIAIASANIITLFSFSGIGDILLQQSVDLEHRISQSIWVVLISSLLPIVIYIAYISIFHRYHQGNYISILWVVLGFSLINLCTPYVTRLKAALKFKSISILNFGQVFVQSSFSIVGAMAGMGPISLTFSQFCKGVFGLASYRLTAGRIHFSQVNSSAIRPFAIPTALSTIANIATILQANFSILILSHYLSRSELGAYSWSLQMAVQLPFLMTNAISSIALPIFLSKGRDPSDIMRLMMELSTIILSIITGIQFFILPIVVYFLLNKQWLVWVVAMQIICLSSLGQPTTILVKIFYNSIGQYHKILLISALQCLLYMTIVFFAANVGDFIECMVIVAIASLASDVMPPLIFLIRDKGIKYGISVIRPLVLFTLCFALCAFLNHETSGAHQMTNDMLCSAIFLILIMILSRLFQWNTVRIGNKIIMDYIASKKIIHEP
jgi:O-antigen/teichoic acid export membrane protein